MLSYAAQGVTGVAPHRAAVGPRVTPNTTRPAIVSASRHLQKKLLGVSSSGSAGAVRRARQLSSAARSSRRSGQMGVMAAAAEPSADVVVVGAGVAGLACARVLSKAGKSVMVVESADEVGGRVRTDVVDGFRLDHGFQIFLTSYPEAQAVLDYDKLDLQPFYAGALVHWNGGFHRVADPLRHLTDGLQSLPNPVGSVTDKVRVGVFRLRTLIGSLEALLQRPETTTLERLRAEGFSEEMIDRFFRPFLGGIFFDRELNVTSRLFEFVMRMLATGSNCLPSAGISAVSEQLAASVPAGAIKTGTTVASVSGVSGSRGATVTLEDGTELVASSGVVVATTGPQAERLLGQKLETSPSKAGPAVGTVCLYFKAPKAPSEEPILYLNGTDSGIVNNCCFPSTVSPSYAPNGQALVSVSLIGTFEDVSDEDLATTVKSELSGWFTSKETDTWSLIRTYRIPFAQPGQAPPTNLCRPVDLGDGLYVCGDHRDTATLDGALLSGRRAAEAIISKCA